MIYYIEISGNTFYIQVNPGSIPKVGFPLLLPSCHAAATTSHPILEKWFGPNPVAPVSALKK